MAKARRARRRVSAREIRATPYKFTSSRRVVGKTVFANNCPIPKVTEKKDWESTICSVCMECPHNAVLLLCSSYNKGCRPYMCGTSFRYSNCLDQYKKASTKLVPSRQQPINSKSNLANLKCPLCRGQVKGWTIVQSARDELNLKRRSCMQENCSFTGTFKELRKHMKIDHPCAQPRQVDSDVEQKWRRFETEQDHDNVISTIRSTIPGATVFGDYVIERGAYGSDDDDDDYDRIQEDSIIAGIGRNLVNAFLILQNRALGNNSLTLSEVTDLTETSRDLASDATDLATSRRGVESSGQEEEEAGARLLANLRRQRSILLELRSTVYSRLRNREANQN